MKFTSNPAFSFGTDKWKSKISNIPAPNTYNQKYKTIKYTKLNFPNTS